MLSLSLCFLPPASSTGSAAWTPTATASCPCMSWSISTRNSVRGWRGWASNPCPSRTCSARCSTWSNQRTKVTAAQNQSSTHLSTPFHRTSCPVCARTLLHCSALSPGKITLGDLKRCRMAHIFFDTFFNLEKYLDHEQRDPFAVQKVGLCNPDVDFFFSTVLQSKTIQILSHFLRGKIKDNSTSTSSRLHVCL